MMVLIAVSLFLLIIYAGTTLLIRTRLEALGKFYKFVSWFLILAGFLGALATGSALICNGCSAGHRHGKEAHCHMGKKQGFHNSCQQDSMFRMDHFGKCCPRAYCSDASSEGEHGSRFHSGNCVCCPDGEMNKNEIDTIQE
jgi:hypothetical protein